MAKSPQAFRTISEVSGALDVPAHVLRFWETKFAQVKPVKRGGGRRYYRPEDVDLLTGIRDLLYVDGLTIKGVQKILREQGVRAVAGRAAGVQPPETAEPDDDAPDGDAPGAPPSSDTIPAPAAAPEIKSALPRPVPAAPGPAAPLPDAEAASLRDAVAAAVTRLEALHGRLSADPSEGMEEAGCAIPAAALRARRARGA